MLSWLKNLIYTYPSNHPVQYYSVYLRLRLSPKHKYKRDSWIVLIVSSSLILSHSWNNSMLRLIMITMIKSSHHHINTYRCLLYICRIQDGNSLLCCTDTDTGTGTDRDTSIPVRSFCNMPLAAIIYDHLAVEEMPVHANVRYEPTTICVLGYGPGYLSTKSSNRCLV